ncbi:MAG TPA: hypothetical protein VFZ21_25885 [Gemmatimonadaceae bacterium]|nr:hypothetical protein [Gemmatimonadaceae bacterium]
MNATPIPLDAHLRRLSPALLLGAAALASCDNDRPFTPIPADASAVTSVGGSSLVIAVVDQNGVAPVALGAQFSVALAGRSGTYLLVDNGPGDADSAPGTLRVNGLLGSYTVCHTVAPASHVLPTPPCQSVQVEEHAPAKLEFVDPTHGRLSWSVVDMNNVAVGSAVVTWNDGTGPVPLADNSALDLDKTDGRFLVASPTGTGTVCPVSPAAGWLFPGNQGCVGVPVPPGKTTAGNDFGVTPAYSAYWYVGDPNGWGAGPSAYTVTSADGAFSVVVEDDGVNDRWDDPGNVWVALSAAGDYTACQTTPPPNAKLAARACIRFTAKHGEPAYPGTFVSEGQ